MIASTGKFKYNSFIGKLKCLFFQAFTNFCFSYFVNCTITTSIWSWLIWRDLQGMLYHYWGRISTKGFKRWWALLLVKKWHRVTFFSGSNRHCLTVKKCQTVPGAWLVSHVFSPKMKSSSFITFWKRIHRSLTTSPNVCFVCLWKLWKRMILSKVA